VARRAPQDDAARHQKHGAKAGNDATAQNLPASGGASGPFGCVAALARCAGIALHTAPTRKTRLPHQIDRIRSEYALAARNSDYGRKAVMGRIVPPLQSRRLSFTESHAGDFRYSSSFRHPSRCRLSTTEIGVRSWI